MDLFEVDSEDMIDELGARGVGQFDPKTSKLPGTFTNNFKN